MRMNMFLLLCLLICIGGAYSWLLNVPVFIPGRALTRKLPAPSFRTWTSCKLAMNIEPSTEQTIDIYMPEETAINDEPVHFNSLSEEVNYVVDKVLEYSKSHQNLAGFDPKILLVHSSIITSGRLYEDTMNDRLHGAKNQEERAELDKVDALMRGFITAERKQRARLKLVYIIAGAQCGSLDEAIKLLSDSDEIDDELMKYLDGVIKKEQLKTVGPSGSRLQASHAPDEEGEALLGDGIRATLSVLRMVQKLLKAQLSTADNKSDVKLLSALLNQKDPEARYAILTTTLVKIEEINNFAEFLVDGIAYMKKRRADANKDTPTDASSTRGKEEVVNVQLPVGVVEQMKDILLDVQSIQRRLETGLPGGELYSTDAEDFVEKRPLAVQ